MLVSIGGFKRSDKGVAARALVRAGFIRIAFADAVRRELFEQYPGAADADKDEPQDFLGGQSVRDLLIKIGRERRAMDPLHWVRIARGKIDAALAGGRSVVVSDMRLPAEVDLMRQLGATLVWIEREGATSDGAETEQDLSLLCDVTLANRGSLDDLERAAIGLLGDQRCAVCDAFHQDRAFPRSGFCQKGKSIEQRSRLFDIGSTCAWPDRFEPREKRVETAATGGSLHRASRDIS